MSATNSTTNYNLPIFIASDSPKWLVDWNGAMNIIDSAINTVATVASGSAGDITSLQSDLQTLSGTVTTQGTSISTLTSSLSTLTGTVNTITSLIGNGEPTTTDKTIIGAINELHADISGIGTDIQSANVSYDNTTSGMTATNVQSAIDELYGDISGGGTPVTAQNVSFTNTGTGLESENVQAAIVELDSIIEDERSLVGSELLLVTDSFGQNPNGNVLTGFGKCISGTNTLAAGGASFASFATMLGEYTGTKSDIKSIILIGGTNEHSTASVETGLAAVKEALDDYPNAKVYIAFVKSNFATPAERALVTPLVQTFRKQCKLNGFVFLGNFNHCMYPTFANVQDDGGHLMPTAGEKLGTAIFNAYANGINEPLTSSTVTATSNGLTFTMICDENGEISIAVSGTTDSAIAAGSFQTLDFDTYYYADAMPSAMYSVPLQLPNNGAFIFSLRDGEIKYYYSVETSGQTTLASGTTILARMTTMAFSGTKRYKVTNS